MIWGGDAKERKEVRENGDGGGAREKCVDQEDKATDKQTDGPTADSGFFQFFQVVQGRSSSRPGEASSKLAANGHAYAPTLRPRQGGVSQMTRRCRTDATADRRPEQGDRQTVNRTRRG